jgi:hypothetical protein
MKMKMIVKVHLTPNGKMLAVCDSDILGKRFEEDDRQLDLSSLFYQGGEKSEDEIKLMLKDVYVINAVGEKTIAFLIRQGLIEDDHVMKISGIPYAQCVVEH